MAAGGGSTAVGGGEKEEGEVDGVGGGGGSISGWFPLYDTINGIRGHLRLTIKLHYFPSINPLSPASTPPSSILLLSTSLPAPALLLHIHGHLSVTLSAADPEYAWMDNFRASRTSNEARVGLFNAVLLQLARRARERCEELGGNAVVGWKVALDLEGEVGVVVARAHGTAVTMASSDRRVNVSSGSSSRAGERSNERAAITASRDESNQPTQADHANAGMAAGGGSHSDSAANQSDKLPSLDKPVLLSAPDTLTASSSASIAASSALSRSYRRDVHLITMSSFPTSMQLVLGGLVVARSVKLLTSNTTTATHEKWWAEIRKEVKSHAASLHCTHVLGYSEQCVVTKDVVVLSGYGTAARGGWLNERDGIELAAFSAFKLHRRRQLPCAFAHVPYSRRQSPLRMQTSPCGMCGKRWVPEVLLSTLAIYNSSDDSTSHLAMRVPDTRPLSVDRSARVSVET